MTKAFAKFNVPMKHSAILVRCCIQILKGVSKSAIGQKNDTIGTTEAKSAV